MHNVHFENRKVSRLFFAFVWFMYVVVYMTKNCFSAAMASIVFEGVMTKSQTGLITSVFYLVYAPLQVFGGIAADKYDPEKLIQIGLIGSGLANLVVFLCQNYYVVLATWIFNAIVQFAIWPSVFKIVSSQLIKSDRKTSAFYLSFSATTGLLLAYLVAAMISKWQYNFLVSSISLFVLAAAMNVITAKAGRYMISDAPTQKADKATDQTTDLPTFKLFLQSGFLIFIVVGFLRAIVGNSIKTLSATMFMESYENVSPSIGNLMNMLIIAVGVLGVFFTKYLLYPKLIKSSPNAVAVMFAVVVAVLLPLVLFKNINIVIAIVLLCIASAAVTATVLLMSYCTLRFEKFGKSGTASGIMNTATSTGVIVNSYGIAKIAEVYDWNAVIIVFVVLSALALVLCCVMIPFWKRFKKIYFTKNSEPLAQKN